MARRNDHSREELKSMALAAVRELVEEQGLSGLSTRKVAAGIGYTVGTLYQVFRNLDEMILQANALTLDELAAALGRARRRNPAPARQLRAMARAYLRFSQQHARHWSLLFEHHLPEDEPLPHWYRSKVDALFDLVEEVMRPLAPRRSAREARLAGRALWGGVHGVCVLAHTDKTKIAGIGSASSIVDALLRHFIRGYVADGGNPWSC